jgi:hypothetical protein
LCQKGKLKGIWQGPLTFLEVFSNFVNLLIPPGKLYCFLFTILVRGSPWPFLSYLILFYRLVIKVSVWLDTKYVNPNYTLTTFWSNHTVNLLHSTTGLRHPKPEMPCIIKLKSFHLTCST